MLRAPGLFLQKSLWTVLLEHFTIALRVGDPTALSTLVEHWYRSRIAHAILNRSHEWLPLGAPPRVRRRRLEALMNAASTPSVAAMVFWMPQHEFADGAEARLERAFRIERARLGDGHADGWSERGDLWMSRNGQRRLTARVGGLAIDTKSPHRLEGPAPTNPARLGPETPIFAAHARASVSAALRLLAKREPNVLRFVQIELQVVVPTVGPRFSSSSTFAYPGRAVLKMPPSLPPAPIVAEALVHEAIHMWLFRVEAFSPFVHDPKLRGEVVESRWSGATIPVAAYLHACFVWSGLYWFWRRSAGRHVDGFDWKARMDMAARGFANDAVSALTPFRDGISGGILDVCRRLQDDVRHAEGLEARVAPAHRRGPAGGTANGLSRRARVAPATRR
jgi:HEXXH motif-containing protein